MAITHHCAECGEHVTEFCEAHPKAQVLSIMNTETKHVMSGDEHDIPIANPTDRSKRAGLFLFSFGAYGWTRLYVWTNHPDCYEDAFEIASEWLDDHAPGFLSTIGEAEYREAATELGLSYEDAFAGDFGDDASAIAELAEADMIMIGHTTLENGNAIPSWEVSVSEIHPGEAEHIRTFRDSFEAIAPSPVELVEELAELAECIEPCNVEPCQLCGDGPPTCAVRLQVYSGGDFRIHEGDPGYDSDHSGYWGAASIPRGATREELLEIAKDLVEQVLEQNAEGEGYD